jgi:hypothetical protein
MTPFVPLGGQPVYFMRPVRAYGKKYYPVIDPSFVLHRLLLSLFVDCFLDFIRGVNANFNLGVKPAAMVFIKVFRVTAKV